MSYRTCGRKAQCFKQEQAVEARCRLANETAPPASKSGGVVANVRAKPDTVEILRFPGTFMGEYWRPKPFGGMGKPLDEEGFSDHFPVGVQVTEAG
jgi:hypothetical protein